MGFLAVAVDEATAVAVHRPTLSTPPEILETPARLSVGPDGTARIGQLDGVSVARTIASLSAHVTFVHGGVVPIVGFALPPGWGPAEIVVLRDALARTGMPDVRLISANRARFEFESVDSSGQTPLSDTASRAIGALAVLESPQDESDPDTDAIPVIVAPAALAFSESPLDQNAAPIPPSTEPNRRRPLVVVTAAAVAVIAASVGIAAALGTFDDGAEVTPPAITDAQTPETSAPLAPAAPTSAIPFPTTEPPAQEPARDPVAVPPPVVTTPARPQPQPPALDELPPPEEEQPPSPTGRPRLTYPTIPDFTYPTIPDFGSR